MSSQSTVPAPAPLPLHPATSKILIIGAGTFGLSTAYYLQEDGFKDITVLDKAAELPALDAASTDINKGMYHMILARFPSQCGHER